MAAAIAPRRGFQDIGTAGWAAIHARFRPAAPVGQEVGEKPVDRLPGGKTVSGAIQDQEAAAAVKIQAVYRANLARHEIDNLKASKAALAVPVDRPGDSWATTTAPKAQQWVIATRSIVIEDREAAVLRKPDTRKKTRRPGQRQAHSTPPMRERSAAPSASGRHEAGVLIIEHHHVHRHHHLHHHEVVPELPPDMAADPSLRKWVPPPPSMEDLAAKRHADGKPLPIAPPPPSNSFSGPQAPHCASVFRAELQDMPGNAVAAFFARSASLPEISRVPPQAARSVASASTGLLPPLQPSAPKGHGRRAPPRAQRHKGMSRSKEAGQGAAKLKAHTREKSWAS